MKRQRTGKHPLLEEAVALWISRAVAASLTITGEIMQEKAKNIKYRTHMINQYSTTECSVETNNKCNRLVMLRFFFSH